MKTTINLSTEFLAAAGSLLKPLARSKVKPILENIRIDAKDGEVRMFATNLTSSATIVSPCDFKGELSTLLPADRLFGFASQSPKSTVSISLNGEAKAEIRSESAKLLMPTADPGEFPGRAEVVGQSHVVPCRALKSACRISYACSSEDSRYALGGPSVTLHKGWLHLAATDSHKGAVHRLAECQSAAFDSVPLPYESFGLLSRLPDDGDCSITVGVNAVLFDAGNVSMVIRRVEARFPRLHDVISSAEQPKATIQPSEIIPLIAPSLLLYAEDSKGCELTLAPEEIVVSKAGALGEARAAVAAKCIAGASSMFDGKWLRDTLASFPDGTPVEVRLKDDEALFLSIENYQTILMPFSRERR